MTRLQRVCQLQGRAHRVSRYLCRRARELPTGSTEWHALYDRAVPIMQRLRDLALQAGEEHRQGIPADIYHDGTEDTP